MSPTMFIVGTVIFGAYMYFLIWNIFYSARKQREENYPGLNGMGDVVEYDGSGKFKRVSGKVKSKQKTKNKEAV